MDGQHIVFKGNSTPCLPNCSKKAKRVCSLNCLMLFTHKRPIPSQEDFPNQGREHLRHSKQSKEHLPHNPCLFHNGEESGLWIPHPLYKNNIYLLELIPSSEFGPKLRVFPHKASQEKKLIFSCTQEF